MFVRLQCKARHTHTHSGERDCDSHLNQSLVQFALLPFPIALHGQYGLCVCVCARECACVYICAGFWNSCPLFPSLCNAAVKPDTARCAHDQSSSEPPLSHLLDPHTHTASPNSVMRPALRAREIGGCKSVHKPFPPNAVWCKYSLKPSFIPF